MWCNAIAATDVQGILLNEGVNCSPKFWAKSRENLSGCFLGTLGVSRPHLRLNNRSFER